MNVLDMRKTPKNTIDKINYIASVNILMVSPETAQYLPAQMILDRIYKIHNLGELSCHSEHMSAIRARLGIQEEELNVIDDEERAPEPQENGLVIGNANLMVL